MASLSFYDFIPDQLENLPDEPLEMKGPESERPEDFEPSQPPFPRDDSSGNKTTIYHDADPPSRDPLPFEHEGFEPHWNQFVALLRGEDQKLQVEKLPVLEEIGEKVGNLKSKYRERIDEEEQFISALEDENVTMYGIKPHPERIDERLERAQERLSKFRKSESFLRIRSAAAKRIYRRFVFWGKTPVKWEDLPEPAQERIRDESKLGRKRTIEKPEEVLRTLNVVCQWLDTNPPAVFRGEGGLVSYASEEFSHLTKDGLKSRISSIFPQLAQRHPDLTTPDFTTGMNGSDYVENEEEIRTLRDEYKARFVEK